MFERTKGGICDSGEDVLGAQADLVRSLATAMRVAQSVQTGLMKFEGAVWLLLTGLLLVSVEAVA